MLFILYNLEIKTYLPTYGGVLAIFMASEYEIPGYIVVKALFWTVSMLSDRYTGKLVCSTGQAYSTTGKINDKQITLTHTIAL